MLSFSPTRLRLLIFQVSKKCKHPLANRSSLEHELTYYTCLHKGDTICITHARRQYLVNVTDCKPED